MRVARSLTLERTEIQEHPDPEPGPGDVVCRVLYEGLTPQDAATELMLRPPMAELEGIIQA